jgi:hypothetical protein
MLNLKIPAPLILDFDIENRPLSYLGHDFTTAEVTAIAWSFGLDEPVKCVMLGKHAPVYMLEKFRTAYDHADCVTGHYIRKHDLPHINGAMIEYGLPPLGPKMTCDTKLDLIKLTGISKSQESLGDIAETEQPKFHMTQAMWREANRLCSLGGVKERVTADVRQHQELRLYLAEHGYLRPWKLWSP